MSIFGKIFGGGKSKPEPTTHEAMQAISEQEEMLLKKQGHLTKQIETTLATAKKHAATDKRKALTALKQKKGYEKQLEHVEGVLNTLQQQKSSLENAALHSEILDVMGKSSAAMRAANKGMDVEKVHDMMEDIAEQQEVLAEITQAISNPIGMTDEFDKDELLKELEELEQADLDEELLKVGPAPVDPALANKFPEVPKERLPKTKAKKEEDDLAELEQWATG